MWVDCRERRQQRHNSPQLQLAQHLTLRLANEQRIPYSDERDVRRVHTAMTAAIMAATTRLAMPEVVLDPAANGDESKDDPSLDPEARVLLTPLRVPTTHCVTVFWSTKLPGVPIGVMVRL
jgi:hypothetical protein